MIKTLHLKMVLLLCLIMGAGTAWADDVTVTFNSSSDVGTGTSASGQNSVSKDGITISCTAGGFAISGGAHYRLASSSTTTISSTVGNIKSIVFNGPTGTGSNSISKFGTNTGWTLDSSKGTYTWTGDAESVTVKANSGQVRPTSIVVTYTPSGSGNLTTSDLTITNQSTALSFDLYNNSSAQVINYTTNSTGAITIVPASPTSYFSYVHDATNNTITVTPLAVTPSAQTVTISQEEDATYNAGSVSFTVSVADSSPLANIAALTAKTTNGSYTVSLTDASVTYVNGTTAYLEDASGAVILYHCAGDLAVGDKITGTANVTYTIYNGLPEVTAITLASGYTKTSGNTVTPTEVTIATLESNYTSYLSRYVKIVGATVTSAFSSKNSTIEQNGSSIILRDQNSSATLTTTLGSTVTVTAHPSIYNSTHQIAVYEQSQIVAAKVDPTIAFNNGSVRVGQALDLSTLFTSNSGGAVTYSITAGGSNATLSGSTLTGTAEGSVTVKAEQEATDAFNAGEATATITVNPALVLSSIAVTTAPTKTTYNEGETFDPTGMVVTATYTDNSTAAVTGYTYSPDGALAASDTEITISYTENNVTKTTTQAITVNEVLDYATLPFEWAGGGKSALTALTGVTGSGLGSDYSSNTHGVYIVKFDNTGDYIQVKTDSQPGTVTIGVKMIGGADPSSIIVQQSANGSDFENVETLSISGSQNDILEIETSNAFASTSRYVRLYFNKGANVGVGPITIAKASTDPVINAAASVELTAEATSGEIAYTISNPVDGTSLTAAEKTDVDWISNVTVANDKVTFTTTVNTGSERTAIITLTYGSVTKDVTVTQAEHIDINTYTLASAITSGKHYVIAATISSTNNTYAMGGKHTDKNYYDAVDAQLEGTTLSVASNSGAQEFIIYGPDADGYYTIYDPVAGGYLYASSSSSNDLSYQTTNDDNGRWAIDFENETVTAQGTNTRNLLRYNSGTPRFSCYASGQTAVQFYEKDETPSSVTVTIKAGFPATTFSADCALDFTNVSGITAYVITDDNGSTTEVTTVPANTGLYIEASATANEARVFNIPVYDGSTFSSTTGNKLISTVAGTTYKTGEDNKTYYAYGHYTGNDEDKYAFMKVKTTGLTPGAGKALLEIDTPVGGAKELIEINGGATSIDEELRMTDEESAGAIYDLSGRRVIAPTKGLYIVNGKKLMVK